MANITPYVEKIKNAVYGEEVRDSIVSALDKVNADNEGYLSLKKEVISAKDTVITTVASFDAKVQGAKDVTASLTATTTTANSTKTNLVTATTNGNTAKTGLDTSTGIANTAKGSLDAATTAANTAKSTLASTTATANTARENLQTVVNAAQGAVEDVKEYISNTPIYTKQESRDLFAASPQTTISGNPVEIYPDAYTALGVTVHGRTVQAGSGDPSPTNVREITGVGYGVNLLPSATASTTINGVVFSPQANGGIGVKGVATAKSAFYFHEFNDGFGLCTLSGGINTDVIVGIEEVTSSGAYVRTVIKSEGAPGTSIVERQSDSNKLSAYIRVNAGVTVNTTIYPMLNRGPIAMPFVPYTGDEYGTTVTVNEKATLIPLTAELFEGDEVEVKKSVFDKKVVFNGTENWNSGAIANGNRRMYVDLPIAITAWDKIRSNYYITADGNTQYGGKVSLKMSDGERRLEIYDPAYQTANDWKTHLSALAAAGAPLTIYYQSTNYNGMNGLEIREERRKWGKKVFTDGTGWVLEVPSPNTGDSKRFFTDKFTNVKPTTGASVVTSALCNYLPTLTSLQTYNGPNQGLSIEAGSMHRIQIRINGIATLAQLDAKLKEWDEAGSPLTILYELATPETYAFDPVRIETFPKANTVAGENWMDIRYNKSVESSISDTVGLLPTSYATAFTGELSGSGLATVSDSQQGARLHGLILKGATKRTPDQEPTPDSPVVLTGVGESGTVEVKVVGENLLPLNAQTQTVSGVTFTIDNNGSVKISGTNTGATTITKDICRFTGSELQGTLILTGDSHLKGNYEYESGGGQKFLSSGKPFTISESLKYFRVYISIEVGGTVNTTIYPMLNIGSSPKPYSPYTAQLVTIPVDAPLYNGDSIYRVGVREWVIRREKARRIFDGSEDESWTESTITGGSNTGKKRLSPGVINIKTTGNDSIAVNMISDRYNVLSANTGYNSASASIHVDRLGKMFVFNPAYQVLADWKTHLAANPLTVVYELATPTLTPLPPNTCNQLEALYTYYGTTNIQVNDPISAGIGGEYVRDSNLHIADLHSMIASMAAKITLLEAKTLD